MKAIKISRLIGAATLAAAASFAPASFAADEFNHTVRIIVPFAPGGTSDILARLIAPKLTAAIGQTVIVENKPGAGGNLGADAVAKATKDAHTLLLLDLGTLATAPTLFSNLSYDVEKDLAPVSMVMYAPYVLAVHPSVPAKTVPELIAYGRANPGKLAVANSGVGAINHITAVIMGKELGINFKNVPYKGGAAASRAVVAGESNMILNGVTGTMPFVTSGQLVGIAVTGTKRVAKLPDLPTFQQAKLPQGDAGSFQGLLTTAGSPSGLIQRLNVEIRKILAEPEMIQKIADQGGEVQTGKPEELKAWLAGKIKEFGAAISANNIKVE